LDFLVVLMILWLVFAGLGYYVATQRGRPEIEGVILGFLFGPLGCLIVAMLPARSPRAVAPRARSSLLGDPRALDRAARDFLSGIGPARSGPGTLDMDAIARAVNGDAPARTPLDRRVVERTIRKLDDQAQRDQGRKERREQARRDLGRS
jgi:hypothetical protein